MRLKQMLDTQRMLQENLGVLNKIKNPKNWQQYVNQMILAIQEETIEIMRETAYKNPDYVMFGWKKNQKIDMQKMREKIIDLWHFLMNLMIAADMDESEFYRMYQEKNKENIERQANGY